MLQPLYKTREVRANSVPTEVRMIRLASNDQSGFSTTSSKHVSSWNIDVAEHFKVVQTRPSIRPAEHQIENFTTLNWVITFFLIAVIASVLGFGGLAGSFSEIAKLIALFFVVIFVALLIYTGITSRRPNPS